MAQPLVPAPIVPGNGLSGFSGAFSGQLQVWTDSSLSFDGNGRLVVPANTYLRADGSVPLGASMMAGGFKITGLQDPSSASDAATKSYVDAQLGGSQSGFSGSSAYSGVSGKSGTSGVSGFSGSSGAR